jgi:4-methylaminobutanoate oxidase (formaldehyde-forming)
LSKELPSQAQTVIIGGGVVGCSVAYHLTKLGWADVVLLERKVLTSGTTWAAAGLVGQLWASSALTKLAKYGTELYQRLEAETGQSTGFVRCGSLRVARTEARKHEYQHAMGMARAFGVEIEEIGFEEARKLWPPMKTDDLVSVYYQPNDGHTSPVDTTQAMAKGAKLGGANFFEGVKVTDIKLKNGAVSTVITTEGQIACEYVVNCGGMWAREIGKMVDTSTSDQRGKAFCSAVSNPQQNPGEWRAFQTALNLPSSPMIGTSLRYSWSMVFSAVLPLRMQESWTSRLYPRVLRQTTNTCLERRLESRTSLLQPA